MWRLRGDTWGPETAVVPSPCPSRHVTSEGCLVTVANPGRVAALIRRPQLGSSPVSLPLFCWPKPGTGTSQIPGQRKYPPPLPRATPQNNMSDEKYRGARPQKCNPPGPISQLAQATHVARPAARRQCRPLCLAFGAFSASSGSRPVSFPARQNPKLPRSSPAAPRPLHMLLS